MVPVAAPRALGVHLDRGDPGDRLARGVVRVALLLLAAANATISLASLLARHRASIAWLRASRPGVLGSLLRIGYARAARAACGRGVRSRHLFASVAIEGELDHLDAPCVFALLHSSWSRPLTRIAPPESEMRSLAGGAWVATLGPRVAKAWNPESVLGLVRHLRSGNQATATVDNFVPSGGVPVRFLGFEVRVRPWAVDLAKAGRVPLVPAVPCREGDRIVIVLGPAVVIGPGAEGRERATRALMAFFEGKVREDPSRWSRILPFLGAIPSPRTSRSAAGGSGRCGPAPAPR